MSGPSLSRNALLLIGASVGGLLWYLLRNDEQESTAAPPPRVRETNIRLTREQLKRYNGSDPNLPIYVAVKGKIYDVGMKNSFYGPGGAYSVFAGREANRGLALMSTQEEDAVPSTEGLGPESLEALDSWAEYFENKYHHAGMIID
eukprot:TRINITY_DN14298_c0_g1_i1.p1 TRINITY_DN14298_c0_g1~~TRINITY_DN14298_c0_g1_i1.p1  ORF type:complete len:146 (-),score=27.58 TRINITY_DN14298_c0_g1_i1:255-692(-)